MLLRLVSLGLVQAGVDPNRPDQLLLDTQMLEQYLKRYGPRVTTATGELGVAASQAEIWTPESAGSSLADLDAGLLTGCRRSRRKSRSSSCPASKASCSRLDVVGSPRRPNRSRPPLRSNRYFHFICANCRPDTARRRKINGEAKPSATRGGRWLDGMIAGGLLRLTRKRIRGCNERGGEGVRSEATSRSWRPCKRGDHIVRSPGLLDLR